MAASLLSVLRDLIDFKISHIFCDRSNSALKTESSLPPFPLELPPVPTRHVNFVMVVAATLERES
jgi:hypothetical protein